MRRSMVLLTAALLAVTMLVAVVTPPGVATVEPVHTVGMVDTDQGLWVLWDPLLGFEDFYYGNPGDVPFVGDWDGDGTETPGLYRQADGYVYLRNSNTQGIADVAFFFGDPGDLPLVGDYDGDGDDTVSVYRPASSSVFVINELGSGDAGLGAADFAFAFGDPGDAPFVGDFDGDGVDTVGLHRQSTGRVYFRNSLSTGIADADFVYGDPGDLIIAGDWTGDGTDTVGIFRPADTAFYLNYANARGIADETVLMDWAGTMRPVAGALGRTGMVSFDDYPCTGPYAGPSGTVATSPAPTTPSDAVGVLGMSFTRGTHCDRTLIALGALPAGEFGFFESGVPATSVPAGVEVAAHGARAHVTLPGVAMGRIFGMEFLGEPAAFVVREPPRGEVGDLYVDVLHSRYRMYRASFLDGPARIVIDSIATDTPFGLRLGPIVDSFVALRDPIDPLRQGLVPPIDVVGYARPFEASDPVFLTDAATGAPVTATWSGCEPRFVVPPNAGCVYGTTDYVEAWGEFSFTIEDLAPGRYQLEVLITSPASPEDGGFQGSSIADVFTVLPPASAGCVAAEMLPTIDAEFDVPPGEHADISISECAPPYARVFMFGPDLSFETEQIFMTKGDGVWRILNYGTGIDCATDTMFAPPELETACEALGLR